jgi:glycosyltransferase involved in cell wall biosynthesis
MSLSLSGSGAAVTVVIPVWNDYVEFLTDAVESVRRNALEAPIVVVDNASSTPVPELEGCEVLQSDRRLSAGAARNLGLDRVATEYVVFLDADDMLLDGTLEFLYRRIAADAGLSVCTCSILDGATGERFRAPRSFVPRLVRWPRVFALADSIWSLLPIQGCAIMRTDKVRDAGGYAEQDSGRGEDMVLAVSLAWRGRVEVSERIGLYYRSPRGSCRGRGRAPAELRASTRRVRERMRRDPAVPPWARALLPAIAALQLAAIHLARPLYLAARKLATALRSNVR